MVFIVMGVAGAGKTTIGRELARRLGCRFFDGDDFHPADNVERMRRGQALTDQERGPWLARLAELIGGLIARNETAVVACSALKASHRTRLRAATDRTDEIRFIYLRLTPREAAQRIAGRKDHFMPQELVPSQFNALEEPSEALEIDATLPPADVVEAILDALQHERRGDP